VNEQEVLDKVCDVYSRFDSYADVGTVESPDLPGSRLEFQTHFKRPLKFRFHWLSWLPFVEKSKPGKEYTVWSNGETFACNFWGRIEYAENLGILLAGATGISQGSVNHILNIMHPGALELSWNWHEMTDVKALPEELLHEVECFHLLGTTENSEDCEVWIDKETYIVRRLRQTMTITEDVSAQVFEELTSEKSLEIFRDMAEKGSLPAEKIEEAIAHLKAAGFEPKTYRHIYDYTKVVVNELIDDALFNCK